MTRFTVFALLHDETRSPTARATEIADAMQTDWTRIVKLERDLSGLKVRKAELEAENDRLQALFQQHCGVHHSWVAEAERARVRLGEAERLLRMARRAVADDSRIAGYIDDFLFSGLDAETKAAPPTCKAWCGNTTDGNRNCWHSDRDGLDDFCFCAEACREACRPLNPAAAPMEPAPPLTCYLPAAIGVCPYHVAYQHCQCDDADHDGLPSAAPLPKSEEPTWCECDPDYAHADTNDNGRTWFCNACRRPRAATPPTFNKEPKR